jgi:hypothetical protein
LPGKEFAPSPGIWPNYPAIAREFLGTENQIPALGERVCKPLEGTGFLWPTADTSLLEQLAVAWSCFLPSWQDVQERGLLSRGVDKRGMK